MECAGRALGFWTYQTSASISFEQHVSKALNDKYDNLSLHLEKTVNEANSEIESLQHKITSQYHLRADRPRFNQSQTNDGRPSRGPSHFETQTLGPYPSI